MVLAEAGARRAPPLPVSVPVWWAVQAERWSGGGQLKAWGPFLSLCLKTPARQRNKRPALTSVTDHFVLVELISEGSCSQSVYPVLKLHFVAHIASCDGRLMIVPPHAALT